MKKFSIGQKIRIKRFVAFNDFIGNIYINEKMKALAGKESMIIDTESWSGIPVVHLDIDDRWIWAEEMLELVDKEWD